VTELNRRPARRADPRPHRRRPAGLRRDAGPARPPGV